ncbi:CsgG/HfaB family protein [bacterium]|nr:CsgG/HfaB family protein [bacterium]MBU1991297.1 CsgG/HfaB family protein [bacterium]
MGISIKVLLSALAVAMFMSGCAQKVQIKALNPAEVGEMASKKKVAISNFKNDSLGLSGKIESQIAKHELDKQRYFTVLSRKDMDKVIAEQKLQSSELMDEATSSKVGRLIGAQAIINGEIASANAESGSYQEDREKCLKYYKDGGCAQWRYYKVTCKTTQASVAANLNIVNIETGSIIYGDTISKEYSADSCKAGQTNLGLLTLDTGPKSILSKGQALNKLASDIANQFVYKLTPHYVYFNVTLIEKIELEDVTDAQEQQFENSLAYIKAGRMDKAGQMLSELMDQFDGKSYVVAYVNGVVNEAEGKFDEAKKLYAMADQLTVEPVDEINSAMNRIDSMIAKREEARQQMNAK